MKWNKIFCAATCLVFFVGALFFINNNFWQDELYTLTNFVFVPIKLSLTDYHVANNHILFSVLLNLYKYFFGLSNFQFALLHPYYLRIVPLVFTISTIIFFYFSIKSLFNKRVSLIATSTLVSTFALLNFSVQLRGYSLSIFIAVIQLHYFLKILKSVNTSNKDIYILAIATIFSILCLPVNVYYAVAFIICLVFIYLLPINKQFTIVEKVNKPFILKLIVVLFVAILVSLIYYYWLFSNTATLEADFPLKPFSSDYLIQFFAIIFHFIHFRFYIYFIVCVSLFLFYKTYKQNATISLLCVVPVLVILFYFIIGFIHGTIIIQRIFLVLIPVFSLFIAYSTSQFFSIGWLKNKLYIFLLLNCFSLIISFFVAANKSINNNKNAIQTQDLINHYYLFNYNVVDAVNIAKKYSLESGTHLYINEGFGDSGIKYYLINFNVLYNEFTDSLLNTNHSFTLVSNNKILVEKLLIKKGWYFKKLMDDKFYYNVYYCFKK